jgi:hypothetical protein
MGTKSNEHFNASTQQGLATYEIGIEGEIPSYWPDYLDAIVVIQAVDASHTMMTLLRCKIRDQAQLIGILNLLCSWGSILMSLNMSLNRPDAG